ncbi:MAG: hypothetical protein Phog2KO_29100 [Phototrophicaceae bacterium]
MNDLSYNFVGLDEFKNDIQISYHPRRLSDEPNVLLAELVYDPANPKEGITLKGDEEHEFNISYTDENANRVGAKDVYIASVTWAGGAKEYWVDKEGNQGVNYVDSYPGTLTLIPKANGAILRMRADKISHLLGYEIRGRAVIDMGEKEVKVQDGMSITKYGQRSLIMNLPSLQHNEVARDIAKFELARRKEPSGKIASMTLRSHGKQGDALHEDQLELTVGDRIRVKEAQSGHDGEYFIVGEAHRLSDSATMLETTWYLESATGSNWFVLDVSELDGVGVNAPEQGYVLAY